MGGAVCKSNCCCCHLCAEQPHTQDRLSSNKGEGDIAANPDTTFSRSIINKENSTFSLRKSSKESVVTNKSTTSSFTLPSFDDSPLGDTVGGGGGALTCVNNYLTIKELHDIEEEDDQLEEDSISESSSSYRKTCSASITCGNSTIVLQSPSSQHQQSHHQLQKCDRKKKRGNLRNRSNVSPENSTTCGSGGATNSALSRMQAEQGSIGDLQKYHNRYLRSRRHTLANVR